MDDERKFDPVTPSIKDDVRPDFWGEAGGNKEQGSEGVDKKTAQSEARGAAASDLKGAESAASGDVERPGGGLAEARQSESDAGGFYKGSGVKKAAVAIATRGKFKGSFKKTGPVLGIFFVIFAIGGIMAGTQMFQPFSFVAQLQESFNSMHPSTYIRSPRFLRAQLENGRSSNPERSDSILGKKLTITEAQSNELKRQGIEFDDDYNGTGERVLKYADSKGQTKIVNSDNFKSVYANDPIFSQKYDAGTRTWRGQYANWYNQTTDSFLKANNFTRNMWKDFKQKTVEAEVNGRTGVDVLKEILSKRTNTIEDGGIKRLGQATDENGDPVSDEASSSKIDRQNIDVQEKLNSISSKMQGGANAGCAVFDTIGAISALVAASEALQIINLTTSYMETVDKTKAGYGDEAPINEFTSALNERAENSNVILESTAPGGGMTVNGYNIDLKSSEPIISNKTAMQSAGVAALYGNGLVRMDASVQSFNLTSSMSRIMGGIGTSLDAFEGCMVAKITTDTAMMIADGVGILGCAATFWAGGGMCWGLAARLGLGVVASVGTSLLLGTIIGVITPWVSSALTRDLVTNLGGEDLGNALVSGGNMYMGNIHRANGGSLATREKYEQFAVLQAQVVAEDARKERESLSPFDITSKNTFMGTIMNQAMKFVSSSSVINTITTGGSAISSSLVAMTPSASAVAAQIKDNLPTMEEYNETCPYLASIGAIGDSYCNPYMVTDVTTIDSDPDENAQHLVDSGDLTLSGDNYSVVDGGGLSKYALYCDGRSSPFGIPDQNIVASVQGASSADSVIGAVPVIGDAVDIAQNAAAAANIGYISGQSCVAGTNDNGGTESPNWDTAKYYQRFIEDQSLAETMGLIDKSAVTAYLEEYYEENPLDNSYEGMLARYSGLDKETVSDVLDVIAYYNYINNYDPSERYAFGEPVVDEEQGINLEHEYVMDGTTVALEGVIYADVRNRNFAV